MKKNVLIREIAYIAVFIALAILIGMIQIPMFGSSHLDFSEIVILIAFLVLGYLKTSVIILIRSLIRLLLIPNGLAGPLKMYGELIAVIASLILVTTFYILRLILRESNKPLLGSRELRTNRVSSNIIIAIMTVLVFVGLMFIISFVFTSVIFSQSGHIWIFSYFKAGHEVMPMLSLAVLYIPLNVVKSVVTILIVLILKKRIENYFIS